MTRSWQDLFYTGEDFDADREGGNGESEERKQGFFMRLRENLAVTRKALAGEFKASLVKALEDKDWEQLEEALIFADVGARTTAELVGELEREVEQGDLRTGEDVSLRLKQMIADMLRSSDERIDISHSPSILLTVGVNGTGKTTTIGKIAWHLQEELGKSVLLSAADTFRAAAVEQLEKWAERVGCDIVKGQRDSDSAAVVFDSIEAAQARECDVVICDTAGRLHTETNLMQELEKIRRVVEKQVEGAPHETLLTIDATTGQNGLRQAELFREAVGVSGVCLTKLDGTAKGGIACAISNELKLPIKLIGIGEDLDDLRPFDSEDFASALLGGEVDA